LLLCNTVPTLPAARALWCCDNWSSVVLTGRTFSLSALSGIVSGRKRLTQCPLSKAEWVNELHRSSDFPEVTEKNLKAGWGKERLSVFILRAACASQTMSPYSLLSLFCVSSWELCRAILARDGHLSRCSRAEGRDTRKEPPWLPLLLPTETNIGGAAGLEGWRGEPLAPEGLQGWLPWLPFPSAGLASSTCNPL
jgi:hypothetical protein